MEKIFNQLVKIKNPEEGQEAYGHKFSKGRWSKIKEVKPKQKNNIIVEKEKLLSLQVVLDVIQIIGIFLIIILILIK